MSQSVVPHVVGQESLSAPEAAAMVLVAMVLVAMALVAMALVAMAPHARCSQRHVPRAANRPKYPSSRAAADRYTAATATAESDLPSGTGFLGDTGRLFQLMCPKGALPLLCHQRSLHTGGAHEGVCSQDLLR